MTICQEIEYIRTTTGASIVDMCNALLLTSEQEYWEVINGKRCLSTIQIVGIMEVFQIPLTSIKFE